MRESISVLLELRQIDDRLRALQRRAEARQADATRRRLEAAGRRRRDAEGEVQGFRKRKDDLAKQLQGVKTNVEYQANLKESATMEAKAREWEEVILEAMEIEEATQRTAARLRQDLAEKERVAAEEEARAAAEVAAVQAEERELEARRSGLIERLAAPVRSKYERLRAAKGETAIVAVTHGSCGGCHYNLPPQTVNEVRRGDRMILCEGCGRILVWVDGSPPAGAS